MTLPVLFDIEGVSVVLNRTSSRLAEPLVSELMVMVLPTFNLTVIECSAANLPILTATVVIAGK